jgi:hypothetical protein
MTTCVTCSTGFLRGPYFAHRSVFLQASAFSLGTSINGQNVSLPTSSANGTQGAAQLTAAFDTGDTFPLLPKVVVDAMCANVLGAKFSSDLSGGLWQVPCTAEINVAFYFGESMSATCLAGVLSRTLQTGGQAYPIHPLDTVMDGGLSGGDCVGAVSRMSRSGSQS